MLADAQKPGITEQKRQRTYLIVVGLAIALTVVLLPILLITFIFGVNLLMR